jgi:voltage-gated potassium channel
MKFLFSQLGYVLADKDARTNLRALLRYLLFLSALVTLYAVTFHLLKLYIEGERYSWITGFYWTLVVMTTLGLGDITFTSDLGRLFSMVVLVSGVVFLLVMLPFLFIRLFYAPWLENRVRLRAPRFVPERVSGHVIITEYDAVAVGLVGRLRADGIPYVVVEPDPAKAAHLISDGVTAVTGDNDSRETYERLRAPAARMVLANCEDTTNTNITLTVREAAPDVPIVAIAEEEDAVDVLQLSGATSVLPLKQQLGQYLSNRVGAGRPEAHVIGAIGGVEIAEIAARDTPFTGTVVRETRLRERTGLSVVGIWHRGKLLPAFPTTEILPGSVIVVAGSPPQLAALNELLPRDRPPAPVLVIGAGKVGQAAAQALKRKGIVVYAIDREGSALQSLANDVDKIFAGDAADRELIERAGIHDVASVLLTTNNDAMNIYLAVYCRRLNRELRIVSRITHERNVEAIHRAGADFALSYTSLGVEGVMSLLGGSPVVLLGEGIRLFEIHVPPSLANRPLAETGIGSRTGLAVVALHAGDALITRLTSETVLPKDARLVMLGSPLQRQKFADVFEGGRPH